MSHVFISHVEEDEGLALEAARALEAAGYATWYYERDSLPGPPYLLQVGQAIDAASAMLLIITPRSVDSQQMTTEIVRAHETDTPFIPLRQEITHAEFQARQPLWRQALGAATAINVPPEGVAAAMQRVVAGLEALGITPLGQQARAPSLAEHAAPAESRTSTGPSRPIGSSSSGEDHSVPAREVAAAYSSGPVPVLKPIELGFRREGDRPVTAQVAEERSAAGPASYENAYASPRFAERAADAAPFGENLADWAALGSLLTSLPGFVVSWCVLGPPVNLMGVALGIGGLWGQRKSLAVWGIALNVVGLVIFTALFAIGFIWGLLQGGTGK